MTGPTSFTVLDVQRLDTGQVRVLARREGGRLVRLVVAPAAANGPTIDAMLAQIMAGWPAIPPAELTEGF